MRTAVLYSQEQAENFLRDRPDADRIFPLTPNALAVIVDHVSVPILSPSQTFNDYRHRRVLARARRWKRKLEPLLRESIAMEEASWEVFRNTSHNISNAIFYLQEVLRGTGPWLLYNGNQWVPVDDHSLAFDLLFADLWSTRVGIFGLRAPTMQPKNNLLQIINRLILFFFVNKNSLWVTGSDYNLKTLIGEITKLNRDISVIIPGRADKFSVLRTIRMLGRRYLPWLQSVRALELIPVTSNGMDYRACFHTAVVKSQVIKSPQIEKAYSEFVGGHVNYTESLMSGLADLLERSGAVNVVAYQLRWLSAPALAQSARNTGVPVTLISHGSHSPPADSVSKYAMDRLADGLLVSSLATRILVQSPQADQAVKRLGVEIPRQPSKPLVWGHEVAQSVEKKRVFTILHASTYKVLCSRPWIYETPSEFVYGLQKLIEAIEPIENVHLIIRIRENAQECNMMALRSLLPVSEKYHLASTGRFQDHLQQSDMLISFSSTAIEEALYANRPVGLFGGSNRYRHLSGQKNSPKSGVRSAVYHLSNHNLTDMLRDIVAAHRNSPLTQNELRTYVWGPDVPGKKEFVLNNSKC